MLCLQWSRRLFEHAGMRALKRTRVSLHILTEMWLYVFAADVQHEREQVVFTSGESIDSSAALKYILLFYMSEGGIVVFYCTTSATVTTCYADEDIAQKTFDSLTSQQCLWPT